MYPDETRYDCELDRMLTVLARRPRRRVLLALTRGSDRERELTELARFLEPDVQTATLELHHRHLPKLVDAGLVDWNPETGSVGCGPRYEAVLPLVEEIATFEEELEGPV